MYISGTDSHGLHHLVSEVVDNSIDECVNNFATKIGVKINADGSLTPRFFSGGQLMAIRNDLDSLAASIT